MSLKEIGDSAYKGARESLTNISAAGNKFVESAQKTSQARKAQEEAVKAHREAEKRVREAERKVTLLRQQAADPNLIREAEQELTNVQAEQTKAADVLTQATNEYSTNSYGTQTAAQGVGEAIVDATGIGDAKLPGLSETFYRDLGASMKGQATGNQADVERKTAKAQAQNYRNETAHRQMEAQQSQQIANQNAYSEAGKIASVQNDAENRQNINNTSFAAGTGAARLRKTNAPDVQSQMQREDQQRQTAAERREAADVAQFQATAKEGTADSARVNSRDIDDSINESGRLAKGEGSDESETESTESTENTENTEPTDNTKPDNTKPDNQPKDQPQSMPSGEPQHVINALLGTPDTEDLRNGSATQDKELYDWAISQGVTPLQAGQHKNENDRNSWEAEFIANNGEAGQRVMQQLRQGRAGAGNDPSRNFSPNERDQMNNTMTVGNNDVNSDARIKNLRSVVSDMNMKWIKEDWDRQGGISPSQLCLLLKHAGKLSHNDREYGLDDEDDWENNADVTNAYADHIRNYVYNYKPEAQEIDPRNDPSVEHIGPMAQDIEQVNPAVVHENAQGIKSVDTSRLAMMNAGAIGDLARMLKDIDSRLKKAGI